MLFPLTLNTKSRASIEARNWTVPSINKGFWKLISDSCPRGRALIEQNRLHPSGPSRERGGNQEGMLSKKGLENILPARSRFVTIKVQFVAINGRRRASWQKGALASCQACGRSHFCPDELCTAKGHWVGRWKNEVARLALKGETKRRQEGENKGKRREGGGD